MFNILNKIVLAAVLAAGIAGAQPSPAKRTEKQESFLRWILKFTGISATPAGLRGDDEADPKPGDIWVTGLSTGDAPRQLTRDGGYRSPIFGDGGKSILALRGAELVEVAVSDSATRRLPAPPNLSKLVARESGAEGKILALTTADRVGKFAPSSAEMEFLILDRESAEDSDFLRRLKNWMRVGDGWSLYVKHVGTSPRTGWTDIFIKQGSAREREVSHCRGAYCSQPSLAEDGRHAVYIRTEKKSRN